MKNKNFFWALVLTIFFCFILIFIYDQHYLMENNSQTGEIFLKETDLSLPSIFHWLPNTKANPQYLIPKIKLSKNR